MVHWLLLAIATVAFCLSHSAQAQGLLDQGKGLLDQGKSLAGGDSGSRAAGLVGALPLDKIISLLQQQGYSNITGLAPSSSGNTLQATAVNASGSPVDLLINPTTGGVISALAK